MRKPDSANSEADATFFVFDSGSVVNGSYVASVMNRLSTGEMTTFTMPYAVREIFLNVTKQVFSASLDKIFCFLKAATLTLGRAPGPRSFICRADLCTWVHSFGIRFRISDPRALESWYIKRTK